MQTRLELQAKEHDVHVIWIHPAYTSKTCHKCNSKDSVRMGISFECKSCGYKGDADVNASFNITTRGEHSTTYLDELEAYKGHSKQFINYI